MASLERAKVVVDVTITTQIELSDDGYLGTGATVDEHLKKAQADVKSYQVLLKQGGLDAQPVSASYVVTGVRLIPKVD